MNCRLGKKSDTPRDDARGVSREHKSDGLPTPKIVLYAPEKIKLIWEKPRKVGVGLCNLGNTCFLNSVLQCLSYTAPLANHLLSGQHKSLCKYMFSLSEKIYV